MQGTAVNRDTSAAQQPETVVDGAAGRLYTVVEVI